MRWILILFVTGIAFAVPAQNGRSPFRKRYTRLGIQTLGKDLDGALSPKDNMLSGNFGTALGFVFEKGHIFYFIAPDRAKLFNAGLDWTVLSLTYNNSANSWNNYSATATGYNKEDFTAKFAGSVATRLGPVLSVNPVQDLVLDLRLQALLGVYVLGPMYESASGNDAFYTYKEDASATGFKKITGYLSNTAIKPDVGVSVRWRAIGIAMDYAPGKVNAAYTETTGGIVVTGRQKLPLNSLQVKLNLTL